MAGQDIKKRLPPGGAQPVNVSGDYIYLKFADRPIDIIINEGRTGQTRVTMEVGDKYRPGSFKSFEISNTDSDREAQVILTVGEGDFNRQVVQGELSIEPILRRADGTVVPDTRKTVAINLAPTNLALSTFVRGNLVRVWQQPLRENGNPFSLASNRQFAFRGRGGNFTFYGLDTDKHRFFEYDGNFNEIAEQSFPRDAAFTPFSWTYREGFGFQFVAQTGATDRLYQLNLDGTITELKNFGNTGVFRFVHWAPELGFYIFGSNAGIYAMAGNLTDPWLYLDVTSSSNPVSYDPISDEVQIAYFSTLRCYDRQGSLTRSIPNNDGGNFSFGFSPVDFNKNQTLVNDAPNVAAVVALEDFTTKPEFVARRPGCELAGAMIRPDRIPQVSANITAESLPEGVKLTGEIIKAALEFYFKRRVPDDYLDHVYYVDISRDELGLKVPAISSGNRTFEAAAISDNLGILTPAQIVITTDNELVLGGTI